eukprot:comp12491_c0_seq1/m.7445 comp12491_c0_seq1/g.7445  ORF comp12491_c0_seq1/g.7445 comp12491_c0_seq1/m.7445 type:complete len:396 (+) comp12491_c0_seq1:148-1335(+)
MHMYNYPYPTCVSLLFAPTKSCFVCLLLMQHHHSEKHQHLLLHTLYYGGITHMHICVCECAACALCSPCVCVCECVIVCMCLPGRAWIHKQNQSLYRRVQDITISSQLLNPRPCTCTFTEIKQKPNNNINPTPARLSLQTGQFCRQRVQVFLFLRTGLELGGRRIRHALAQLDADLVQHLVHDLLTLFLVILHHSLDSVVHHLGGHLHLHVVLLKLHHRLLHLLRIHGLVRRCHGLCCAGHCLGHLHVCSHARHVAADSLDLCLCAKVLLSLLSHHHQLLGQGLCLHLIALFCCPFDLVRQPFLISLKLCAVTLQLALRASQLAFLLPDNLIWGFLLAEKRRHLVRLQLHKLSYSLNCHVDSFKTCGLAQSARLPLLNKKARLALNSSIKLVLFH